MSRAMQVRVLAAIGLLAIVAIGIGVSALAQDAVLAPSPAVTWNSPNLRPRRTAQTTPSAGQIQIVAQSPSDAAPSAGRSQITRVQANGPLVDPLLSDGVQDGPQPQQGPSAEPIGPGVEQGPAPNAPPMVPVPNGQPGSYEHIGLGWKPIGTVSAAILPPAGELPTNLAAPLFARAGVVEAPVNTSHNWPTMTYAWQASAVPHNPLYFEDVNLERYGYTHGILQPWISGGRFFLNVIFLPYKLVRNPPGQLQYPLGYYRPGDRAPPVREIQPIRLAPSVVEAAFIVGMIIILP